MNATNNTKDQFEAAYRAKFPRVVFGVDKIAMPCTCEDGGGPTHWAAVINCPEAIQEHLQHEECLRLLREHGVT